MDGVFDRIRFVFLLCLACAKLDAQFNHIRINVYLTERERSYGHTNPQDGC